MRKRTILGIILAIGFASPAFANECPKHMKLIDAALAKNPALSAQAKADVTKLRAEGEAAHKAGKHSDALAALGKAKKALGI